MATTMAEADVLVGDATVLEGGSPSEPYVLVFEDDGETGYVYAVDVSGGETAILDAVHLYNVRDVTDRDIPSKVQLVWNNDGTLGGVRINQRYHAAFDFRSLSGYCRTAFPAPSEGSRWTRHGWSDALADRFR